MGFTAVATLVTLSALLFLLLDCQQARHEQHMEDMKNLGPGQMEVNQQEDDNVVVDPQEIGKNHAFDKSKVDDEDDKLIPTIQ